MILLEALLLDSPRRVARGLTLWTATPTARGSAIGNGAVRHLKADTVAKLKHTEGATGTKPQQPTSASFPNPAKFWPLPSKLLHVHTFR